MQSPLEADFRTTHQCARTIAASGGNVAATARNRRTGEALAIVPAARAIARRSTNMVWRRMLGREELTPVEARAGFLDRPVLVVLIASIAMVSVLFGLLLLGV
jgi:hypothetical protein